MTGGGGHQELNLVPYLDIVTTLTIALILMTMDTNFAAAKVEVPAIGPSAATTAPLSIEIGANGFILRAGDDAVKLARAADGYPYPALTEMLRSLRSAGEATDTLTLTAEPRVPYAVVVATLDAARGEHSELYPHVALAVAAR